MTTLTSGCNFPALTVKITYPTGWMNCNCDKFFPEATKDDVEKFYRTLRKFSREFGHQVNNQAVIQDLRWWMEKAEVAAEAGLLRSHETLAIRRVPLEGLKKRTEKYRNAKELNENLAYDVRQHEHMLDRIRDRKKLFEQYFPLED